MILACYNCISYTQPFYEKETINLKKAMKSLTKRALALILVFAMAVAYLPMTGIVLKAKAANITVTWSAQTKDVKEGFYGGDKTNHPGYGFYLSIPSLKDIRTGNSVLGATQIQEMYDKGSLTVSGMTIDELVSGTPKFYTIDAANYAFRWETRTESFKDGASFTLKKGTLLPYLISGGTGYLELDADYTFTFKPYTGGDKAINTVTVGKTVSAIITPKVTNSDLYATGAAASSVSFKLFSSTTSVAAGTAASGYIEKFDEYIDIAGIPYDTLVNEYGVKVQYSVNGSTVDLRIYYTADTLLKALALNDEIVVKQGLTIPYTDASGNQVVAQLDGEYVFMTCAGNTDNAWIMKGIKYDATHQTYALSSTAVGNTQSNGSGYHYVNARITVSGENSVSTKISDSRLAGAYMEFSRYASLDEARDAGFELSYLYTGQTEDRLQLLFDETKLANWQVGDTILLKAGMPFVYQVNRTVDSMTLTEGILFKVTANTGSALTLTASYVKEFSSHGTRFETGTNYGVSNDGNDYIRFYYKSGYFTDLSNYIAYTDSNAEIFNYISVDGKSGAALVEDGYYVHAWGSSQNMIRLYRSGTGTFPTTNGTIVIFKKGLPVDYTNTSGVNYRYILDKDYGYVYDGTNYVYNPDVTWPEEPVVTGPSDHTPHLGGYPDNTYSFYTKIWGTDFPDTNKPEGITNIAGSGIESYGDGMAKLPFNDNNGSLAYNRSNIVAGRTYVMSYWIYVTDATDGLSVSPFSKKEYVGGPGGYDKLESGGGDYTITLDGETMTAPLSANTEGWKHIEITWTAKSDGDFLIGMARNLGEGAGTVYIDDVMVLDITPFQEHTQQMDAYPSGSYDYYDFIVNTDFSGTTKPDGIAFSDWGTNTFVPVYSSGMAKLPFVANNGVVAIEGEAVAGHEYVLSYWIYVADNGLSVGPYSTNGTWPGGPGAYGDPRTFLSSDAANDTYSVTLDGNPMTATLTTKSAKWQHIEVKWTAPADGKFSIGLLKNLIGNGTVYLDDVMLFDTTEPDVNTQDQGGFSLSTGVWYKGDSNASQGDFINIPLTNNSLKGLHMGVDENGETKTYWYSDLNYELQKDLIDFFGLTLKEMKDYKVKLKLIRDETGGVMCLQIEWGSSLDFIQPGTCLTLKEGLQFTYEYNDGTETKTYGQKLLADYTLIRYVGRDQNSTLMAAIRTSGSDQPGDYDGNKDVDKKDVRLNRLYLCEMFATGTLQIDANEDGTVDARDLVLVIKGMDTGLLTEHNMYQSIQTAEAMTDRVVLSVADDNSSFTVGNMNTTITHGMGTNNGVMSLLDANGVNVLEGATMTPFVTYGTSGKLTEENYSGEHPTRANNTVMGYYYNSLYFRDMDWRPSNTNDILWVEKAYHMYAGKQHEVFRMVNGSTNGDATSISTDVKTFGFELVIPYDKFDEYAYKLAEDNTYKVLPADASNEITAAQNVEYVAIKNNIDGADTEGFTFGFIFAGTNRTGSYVDIISDGDYLTIRQYVNVTDKSVKADCQVAHRLYVERGDGQVGAASRVDSFDGIDNANIVEKTPLVAGENITIDENVDKAKFRGYDYATGLYNFDIDGYHFGEAAQDPDKKFMAGITVHDSTVNRVIYICVNTENELEGAVVLDKNDVQLPIALQVNKNFGHENEEPIYHPESTTSSSTDDSNLDYICGESFMPLLVNVDTTQNFSIVHVYQNWGGFRLKQLSSIEYYLPYYHLSTGVTETTCIAPFGTAYRDTGHKNYATDPEMYSFGLAWLLPDFRGASNDGQYIVEEQEDGTIKTYPSDLQKNSGGTVFGPNSDKGKTMDLPE